MKNLFQKLKTNPLLPPIRNNTGHFLVADYVASAFLIATSYREKREKFVLVTDTLYKAQQLYSLLSLLVDKNKVALFPSDEMLRADMVAENNELSSQRIFTLHQIINDEVDIIVLNTASLLRFLAPPELFKTANISFKVNDTVDLKELSKRLITLGYRRVNKIDQSMQFAIRGDIIDIFSLNMEDPLRIELFDDTIESLRYFKIATQTSFEKVESAYILSASDILFDEKTRQKSIIKLNENLTQELCSLNQSDSLTLKSEVEDIINDLSLSDYSVKLYKYYSYLLEEKYSILDYCKDFKICFVDYENVLSTGELLYNESEEFILDLQQNHKVLQGLEYYNKFSSLHISNPICFHELSENESDLEAKISQVGDVVFKDKEALDIIDSYLKNDYEIIVALNKNEDYVKLKELLDSARFKYAQNEGFVLDDNYKLNLTMESFPFGVDFKDEKVVILTAKELFKASSKYYRYSSHYKEGTILKSYEDLEKGDFVVHEFQGIGVFDCIETMDIDGKKKDFMKILYADEEVLYIPLSQFHLVRKYLGKEGRKPHLSKLHSPAWEKKKAKIKERINDLANRLMLLYKERESVKGFEFPKDDYFQDEFENKRSFTLTEDQEKSLKEIKEDMESSHPMDRLLCGDVGFGKTEVAFCAAFKAINSGKQVAMLCPTTLLARQHYEVALERFKGFDINIAIFSRLVPLKQQNKYIKEIEEGKIHLIIGTHRLLSKDIHYKDLGLLIVDEEQRFGVEQKERIKEIKNNVDVLTLSATPIPRTLQISLIGMRSLSLINTPPKERYPVQTYVLPKNNLVIKELIERELSRQGQVFYLHNRVASIYETADKIQKQLPNAHVGVAHGQMDKEAIEDVMEKFYNGDIDVLVATSIIENGLDVPNANMIIVERADLYGLSQLYQIKGRVGRGDRIAYAYLLYDDRKVLTPEAVKRLKAIKDFTALGSGYKIAQRDLLIRGAGDILGAEQAGFIDSIGLDMYIKLLNETVKEKIDESFEKDKYINTKFESDGYIPLDYAINETNKFDLYASIDEAKTIEDLYKVKKDTIDIYGPLPESVKLLFDKQEIQLHIDNAYIADLKIYPTYAMITLGNEYLTIKGVGNILFEKLSPYISFLNVTFKNNTLYLRMQKEKYWVNDLKNIMITLEDIIKGLKGEKNGNA